MKILQKIMLYACMLVGSALCVAENNTIPQQSNEWCEQARSVQYKFTSNEEAAKHWNAIAAQCKDADARNVDTAQSHETEVGPASLEWCEDYYAIKKSNGLKFASPAEKAEFEKEAEARCVNYKAQKATQEANDEWCQDYEHIQFRFASQEDADAFHKAARERCAKYQERQKSNGSQVKSAPSTAILAPINGGTSVKK